MDDLILAAAATRCGLLVDDDAPKLQVISPNTLARLARIIVRLHKEETLYCDKPADHAADSD